MASNDQARQLKSGERGKELVTVTGHVEQLES